MAFIAAGWEECSWFCARPCFFFDAVFFDDARIPGGCAIMQEQFEKVFPDYESHFYEQYKDARKLFKD